MEQKERHFYKICIMLLALKMTQCDYCNMQYLPPTLYNRLFPDTVLNPQDAKQPQLIPNTTCVFKHYFRKYVAKKTLIFTSGINVVVASPRHQCTSIPLNKTQYGFGDSTTNIKYLVVQSTHIETLQRSAFSSWFGVEVLEISMNSKLKHIEPGAFENLTNVWNLTISDNPNLGTLKPETFQGLINLRGLRYLRNNVTKLSSVTVALKPSILQFLTVLDFTGNNISRIERNDFLPMANSKLNKLIIGLTKTEWIHKEAFDPLGPLVDIILSRNNLNTSVLVDLLNHMRGEDFYLTDLTLSENALSVNPRPILEVVAKRARMLDLQNNHFGVLNPGTFPKMPNLKYLDLTNVMIDDLDDGVLNTDLMPNLIHLYLGGNIFSGLKLPMVLETLRRLDISFNENDLPWNTVFQIDPQVFVKMPILELLNLSGNKINVLRRHTFNNTNSLKILLLRNSFINEIEDGTFESCQNLFYLDLGSNIFPMVNTLSKDIFRGLSELLALDLSNCEISSITDNLFYHLKKLQYLSLRSNSIYQLNSNVFQDTPYLRVLDLRYNILVTWNVRYFYKNICLNITRFDYNHIQVISKDMLQDFMMNNRVSLYANSITCDCNLMNNIAAVTSSRVSVDKLPFSDDLNTCINQQGETIRNYLLMANSAECVNTKWVKILIITLISLIVVAIMVYIIYYYYKYDIHFWFLRTKRRLGLLHYIGSKNRETPDDFKYDAFVSYCIEDEKFVEKMVYILETDCSRFNLCVFERDFKVGDVLTDRILHCMESSRRTILVLTEAFAKSQWCCWEMYIAQSRSISLRNSDPNDPLILIKKSDIPEALMTSTLKYLMKTRVYLEWHDSPVRQKIFWEQLKNSLRMKRVQGNET